MRAPAAGLAALLLASLALRLSAAWSDADELVLRATSDDAYYYFQIARQLAQGNGPSFDGETATNGFHPLWLVVCAAIQAVETDPLRAVHWALSLGAILGTATTALVFAIVRRLAEGTGPALLAAAFYGLHPTFVVEGVDGLETALAVFLLALLVRIHVGAWQRGEPLRMGEAVGLGAVAGCMMLARTDSALVWAAVWLAHAARGSRAGAAGLTPSLVAGAASAVCVVPWLAWSFSRFATLLQVSAVALPEPLREAFLAEHGGSLEAVLGRSWHVTQQALAILVRRYLVLESAPVWPAGAALATALAAMLLAPPAALRSRARRRLAPLLAPATGILAGLLVHTAVRWWFREWYLAPAGWLTALFLGLALAYARDAGERLVGARVAAPLVYAGFALLCATLLGPQHSDAWRGTAFHRVQQLEAARWLEAETEPGVRVGAFNAGILGYFSGRTVVNLDGAVNAEAYRARRANRLAYYILDRRLDYLVDWRGTLPMAGCRRTPAARCRRVAVIGEPLPRFAGSPIWVLRVEPAESDR